MYRASVVVLIVKMMEECMFYPSGMMFFYRCDQGLQFFISLGENSINQY